MAKILTAEPFPSFFCGEPSGRYVQGTSAEMMNLYWRCKSFNVAGSYTNYAFNDPSNPPISTGWSGTITSNASSEIDLVCGAGLTQSISTFGLINSANYLYFGFIASDFYFNSDPNQTVKLYGNFDFETDQDDTGGVNTIIGGTLSPFLINGFQVWEGDGVPVNFNAIGLIEDFSATFTQAEIWPYE